MAMTKRGRFEAAIAGRPVDRPPVTAWVHFVTDESPPEVFAERAASFFERLDFDICKVVNDYRYPLPDGLETIDGPDDMRRFTRLAMDHPAFVQQPRAIRLLRERLGPDVPILDTGFDPFQQVMRKAGYDRARVVFAHPEAAGEMLEAVCATMEDFMAALRAAGCDGVFFSINGAITGGSRAVDQATYERFMRPYDLRMLAAMAPMVRILHVHGAPVDVTRVLDYPIEALSVSDRLAGNPSIADLRKLTDKCLMGGVNEALITERGVDALRAEVRDTVRQNGGVERLIIAPGCTIPTQTPSFLLRAMVEETKALALPRAA
jgi:uroporphyrinogen decarboxylase